MVALTRTREATRIGGGCAEQTDRLEPGCGGWRRRHFRFSGIVVRKFWFGGDGWSDLRGREGPRRWLQGCSAIKRAILIYSGTPGCRPCRQAVKRMAVAMTDETALIFQDKHESDVIRVSSLTRGGCKVAQFSGPRARERALAASDTRLLWT